MRRLLASLALAVLVLSGCGSAETQVPSTSESTADDETTTVAQDQAEATDAEPAGEPDEEPASSSDDAIDDELSQLRVTSPIGEALNIDFFDTEASTQEYFEAAEDLVRACMAERGFEYAQRRTSVPDSIVEIERLRNTLTLAEFVERYGFGIAAALELEFNEDGVIRFVDGILGPAPEVPRTPAEQEAYNLALFGQSLTDATGAEVAEATLGGGTADDVDDGNAQQATTPGCDATGYREAQTDEGTRINDFFELLGDDFNELGERILADERIVAHDTDWERCMAAAGHSYATAGDAWDEANDRANEIRDSLASFPEVEQLFTDAILAGIVDMNAEDRYALLGEIGAFQGAAISPELLETVDEFAAWELQVAGDEFECSDPVLREQVRIEYEEAFVEQHADRLAIIRLGSE